MIPGPELDQLVAEKVMGLLPPDRPSTEYVLWARVVEESGDWKTYRNGDPYPKPYSNDIAAAWEVLEKFPTWQLERNAKGKFVCLLPGGVVQISSTAPVAVCLAATGAVGHHIAG